ncbi:MAG: cation:proton antiporter [Deltaproteobacteria bacterium]|nr:cation:proton antiporter [Deltaproteobacteria bacterium]
MMNELAGIGIILLFGLLSAKLLRMIKLPSVTAYLILGVALGASVFNIIPASIINASGGVSNFVLGLVAFSIGRNLNRENISILGSQVLWISIFESLGSFLVITVLFLLLGKPFSIALVFGAIAIAAAPDAILVIVREYKAKGPLTNTLLGVVAVNTAWCFVIFSLSLPISKAVYFNPADLSLLPKVMGVTLIHIIGSFFLGVVMAFLIRWIGRILTNPEEVLILTVGFIFLAVGVSIYFDLSGLLTCMAFGAALANMKTPTDYYFESLQRIDGLIFLFFFVLAGANLEIDYLGKIGVIGVLYLIFRVLGKMGGVYLGGNIAGAGRTVKKYLGLGLAPQAGLALGCALVAKAEFPEIGGLVLNTIIATTVIYQIFGLLGTKYALYKAGEI